MNKLIKNTWKMYLNQNKNETMTRFILNEKEVKTPCVLDYIWNPRVCARKCQIDCDIEN